jgi:hypothetical protein
MTDIIHEIFSKLHHLLSIAGAEELRTAGRLPSTSPHLRIALEALAEEKATTAKFGRSGPRSGEKTVRERAVGGKFGVSARADRGGFEQLGAFSKEEIVELARSFGVDIRAGRKDSRSRVVRRLESAVKEMPEEKRQRVMSELTGGVDRQTEGWVDLIKKGK